MRYTVLVFFVLGLFLVDEVMAVVSSPPSFENQQFYGKVTWSAGVAPKQVIFVAEGKTFSSQITTMPCIDVTCTGSYGSSKDSIVRVQVKAGSSIEVFVDTVKVMTVVYNAGEATKLDLVVPKSASVGGNVLEQNQNTSTSTGNEGTNTPSTNTNTSASSTSPPVNKSKSVEPSLSGSSSGILPTTCTRGWECGEWQACVGGEQGRSCIDANDCSEKLKTGKVGSIKELPKPKEIQGCVEGAGVITQQVNQQEVLPSAVSSGVVPQEKPVVQQPKTYATCSDGIQNQNEEGVDCGGLCGACSSGLTVVYYIVGIVVLMGLGVGGYFFVKSRSGLDEEVMEELRGAYNSGEQKGLSDSEITSKLVARGWDEGELEKFLKRR